MRVTGCGRRPREIVDRRVVTGTVCCVVGACDSGVVFPSFSISEFTKPGKFEPFDTNQRDDGVSFDGTLYDGVFSSMQNANNSKS